MTTEFNKIYNCFYSKITDDMYMELDKEQTEALLEELLFNALPWFEFPRVNLQSYDITKKQFNVTLSNEEIHIIATYMVISWIDQQLATIELIRMKYSGSDFKFTSQANHLARLLTMKKDYERIGFHLQRLYKRRKADKNGIMRSTLGSIMATSVRNRNGGSTINSTCDCDGEIEWNDFPSTNTPTDGWDNMDSDSTGDSNSDVWESM